MSILWPSASQFPAACRPVLLCCTHCLYERTPRPLSLHPCQGSGHRAGQTGPRAASDALSGPPIPVQACWLRSAHSAKSALPGRRPWSRAPPGVPGRSIPPRLSRRSRIPSSPRYSVLCRESTVPGSAAVGLSPGHRETPLPIRADPATASCEPGSSFPMFRRVPRPPLNLFYSRRDEERPVLGCPPGVGFRGKR